MFDGMSLKCKFYPFMFVFFPALLFTRGWQWFDLAFWLDSTCPFVQSTWVISCVILL